MFRRTWSGLPKDAIFPSGLENLGYFVNDQDEIRSIKNPDNYFQFFINRNPRVNERQRFAFEEALTDLIHRRIEDEGLVKTRLPFEAGNTDAHVPIFLTPDYMTRTRAVLIFGEPIKDLGILAGRVANGPGGVNKGSMVSVVRELQNQVSSKEDPSAPGIVIANPGQLYWWPEGARALSVRDSRSMPLPSLVHLGERSDKDLNSVPGNRTPEEHVAYVFDRVIGSFSGKISLVGVGQSCDILMRFLERKETWNQWSSRLDAMLLLGTVYKAGDAGNESFNEFVAKRCRGYICSPSPLDTPLAPRSGNPGEEIPALGYPCYSSAEPFYDEMIFIRALKPALKYLEDVATTTGYENDVITVVEKPAPEFDEEAWERIPKEEKPSLSYEREVAMSVLYDDSEGNTRSTCEISKERVQGSGITDTPRSSVETSESLDTHDHDEDSGTSSDSASN